MLSVKNKGILLQIIFRCDRIREELSRIINLRSLLQKRK